MLHEQANRYSRKKEQQWENAAIVVLGRAYMLMTGEMIAGEFSISELIHKIQLVTGESAQTVFDSVVAQVELELFEPSIH